MRNVGPAPGGVLMPLHWVLLAIGIVLDVIGTIWLLQGVSILPGSFMTGQPFWAYAGGVVMIAGRRSLQRRMQVNRKASYSR